MKKLLSILTSLSLTSVAATTVVSCSTTETSIDVSFDDGSGNNGFTYDSSTGKYTMKDSGVKDIYGDTTENDAQYTSSQLDSAMKGNAQMANQSSPVAMTFDDINTSLLSVLGFNTSLVVKTQQDNAELKNLRNTFLGRDQNKINPDDAKDTPTVDGISFPQIDTKDYYTGKDQFDKTHINSLTGLLDLYNYSVKNKDAKLNKAAQDSLREASNLYSNKDSAANKLISNFANSKQNPAFTKITYHLPLTTYHTQSQLIEGFASNTKADGKNPLGLTDVDNYINVNTDISMEKTKGKDSQPTNGTILDHQTSDPQAAIVANPNDNADKTKSFVVDKSLKQITQATRGKDDAKNSVMSAFFGDDNAKVYYNVNKDDTSKNPASTLAQNVDEYVVKPVGTFGVTYEYSTNMEHTGHTAVKGSDTYKISFQLDNLAEIYTPIMIPVNGTTLSQVKKNKDGNLTLTFNREITQKYSGPKSNGSDQFTDLKIGDNTIDKNDYTLNDDGSITTKKPQSAKDKITFKSVSIPSTGNDDPKVSTQLAIYNYDLSTDDSVNFTTNQLTWLFRGYKFMDPTQLKDDETTGIEGKFVKQDANGAGVYNDDLNSDIEHNLRDMKSHNWTITKDTGKKDKDGNEIFE